MRRKCSWVHHYRDLHVGDVVMTFDGPKVLVKRVAKKMTARTYGSRNYTVYMGTFFHVASGSLFEQRLGGAEVVGEVIWASRIAVVQ